ncbi:glycosyltransferase [Streptomyces zingiberis]|uniref:D-inositol 3-phosphate glycosyltransferase n=1 Tax=Streptomyces zingiberis TaxID=2053010 RepID=A0ABX1BTP4_9ACTN|nr:glycosyltransferase [Streptomyces zingiberis]NJQ01082.1 glycosyltransferase family 4 protein [Streptomyces zingiberis]
MRIDLIAPRTPWFSPADLDGRGLGGNEATLVLWWRELRARGVELRVVLDGTGTDALGERGWLGAEQYGGPAGADVVIGFRDAAPLLTTPAGSLRVLFVGDRKTPGTEELEAAGACDLALVGSYAARDRYAPLLRPRHGYHVDSLGHALPEDPKGDPAERRRFQCVHMAAPYRGLARLLRLWPRIRQRVPQAQLVLLGGYTLWGYDTDRAADMARAEAPALADLPDGVVHHGPVARERYARVVRESEVMLYPTTYEEMCCVSALECVALGTVPVLSAVAALRERVEPGITGVLVEGDIDDSAVEERFVDEAVRLLLDEERLRAMSARGVLDAPEHSVGRVVDRLLNALGACL